MGAEGVVVPQVRVTLAESAELEVSETVGGMYSGCVCADEARTFRWDVKATSLGMGAEELVKGWGNQGCVTAAFPICIPREGERHRHRPGAAL